MDDILVALVFGTGAIYNMGVGKNIRKKDGFKNEYLFVIPEERLKAVAENELFSFIRVTDIGCFPHARHHYRRRPAGCDTSILLYCQSGSGYVSQQGRPPVFLAPRQGIIIPAGAPHWYRADEETPWSVYWLHFTGALARAPYIRGEATLPIMISGRFGEAILKCFNECFQILKGPWREEEYFLVCQLAGEILAQFMCAGKQADLQLTEKGEHGIEACIRLMRNNLAGHLSLDDLARAAGFSPSHLNALFKKATGSAPVEYFLRMKIQAASKDLFFTKRPIKEVAIDYGIQDPYYFSRLFRKVMGVSPAEYRRQGKG